MKKIPEIYVLWHPSCLLAEVLAPRIYHWLRPGNGLGPQVYYRSLPDPWNPDQVVPISLSHAPGMAKSKWKEKNAWAERAYGISIGTAGSAKDASKRIKLANLQVLLVLIDKHMVCDRSWRYWLSSLCQNSSGDRVILPVALDTTAYNMPPEMQSFNYLRPTGLPLEAAAKMTESEVQGALDAMRDLRTGEDVKPLVDRLKPCLEQVSDSLLKQLTESLTRQLIMEGSGSSKISVFLSHAKADGTEPARRLRDYIYSKTQMAAFYDENDIAFGSVFDKVLNDSLAASSTAAMIAVRSARYAFRPWCRREVSTFRRPRFDPTSSAKGNRRWMLYPLLVVDAMDDGTESLGVPEFGNAPMIRWRKDPPGIEERIVTMVMRDALLAAYHSAVGASIPDQAHRVVINWLPDVNTLQSLLSQMNGKGEISVVHPGQGRPFSELHDLEMLFPNVTFQSFEEVLT